MKIEVLFIIHEKFEDYFYNKSVVVIDVLRATSTIITALANGAKSIIPAPSVEEAMKIAKNLERSTYLLCGERNTKIIDGFDLGNSPLEYTEEKIKDKKLIFTSTNGTKVFDYLKHSKNVLIASILNAPMVVEKMRSLDDEWTIICAGRNGFFDESDAIGAGMLLDLLISKNEKVELNDEGRTSLLIYQKSKNNLSESLKQTDHGKILIANGFEKDIEFISNIGKFSINATYANNNIGILS